MALRRALFGLCIVYVAGQIEMNQGQHQQQQGQHQQQQQPIESIHVQNQLKQQQQQQPIINQANLPPQVPVNTQTKEGDIEGRTNKLRDKNHVHDKDHIMHHLDNIVDKPTSEMTDEEYQFYYFKVHDYDNNNLLDGIELIQAMTDFHHGDEPDEEEKFYLSDVELLDMLEPIFDEDDLNNDGYIDYVEFAASPEL
ncbi:multiple coagulation factor deficiency protein 2 homolog isoform X1 [Anneissia japonica]|uniref:multiple coagulation factor deficiency protein 2 homolog isoform X1 n=1 Tax=Anneissia japonica TaxID=1529436 RepID=UPI00142592BF|nr:multiple coagulation factor deficiency protein 2 homolog isoform X1 [Anneissia japonica]